MIVALQQSIGRHELNVETLDAGLASIVVTHDELERDNRLTIEVKVDDDELELELKVRRS